MTTESHHQPPGNSKSAVIPATPPDAVQTKAEGNEKVPTMPRPLKIYTRRQILRLYNSPLVNPPLGMPDLKCWFGSENEQNLNKKDADASNPTSARDRRFRRDADDGETPSRPTFRSTLSQPSQMGNFKHQSLRPSDRERDKDGDKDRERDIRDKEGQERLRNLSDKYDRDRLALPLTNLRSKERETAPHFSTTPSSRLGAPAQATMVTARRAETRDAKKKAGETSEDWRRGAEFFRSTREDRLANGRKDHDDLERPRSRVRDASRPRRETSTSRRDRERERDDRERDRERRGDRDRDDYRRERDEYRRDRDKNLDREPESDDPRRWRDDGKRDERMAARRNDRQADREHRERERVRDRASHEAGWEPSHDRRWNVADERDGRSKRSAGRERRGVLEEGKDRDDRKDREREKEKEPAWMETYIPNASSARILGGKSDDGALDGIQAWKKDMKEKEQRDKERPHAKGDIEGDRSSVPEEPRGLEKHLDEIQLFKLMMKKEEEKKLMDKPKAVIQDDIRQLPLLSSESVSGLVKTREHNNPATSSGDNVAPNPQAVKPDSGLQADRQESTSSNARLDYAPPMPSPHSGAASTAITEAHSLLSILASEEPLTYPVMPAFDLSSQRPSTPSTSRLSMNSVSQENQPPSTRSIDKIPPEPLSAPVFNPPQSSRLLALGSRTLNAMPGKVQPAAEHLVSPLVSNEQPRSNGFQNLQPTQSGTFQNSGLLQPERSVNQGVQKSDSLRAPPGFSPFEDQNSSSSGFDESRGQHITQPSDSIRRDRVPLTSTAESGAHPDSPFDLPSVTGYAPGKGSRFAKFFDGKAREGQSLITTVQAPVGLASSSPIPSQRQEQSAFTGVLGIDTDHRSMDDLFAMLNSSAQGQRLNPANPQTAPTSGGIPFSQQAQNNVHLLQQQQVHNQQPHHLHLNGRPEALYDSGLDDRNFVPDGMVPGLRSVPAPRNRESGGIFPEHLDDPIHFNAQRVPALQHRALDQMYTGPVPSLYAQQTARNSGILPQQPQYRGGPSPISGQNSLLNPLQRLPPGLANLGGRPPHETSQFPGMAMSSAGLHGNLHGNGPPQQVFNSFAPTNNLGYGGPQMRAPPLGPHQLQNLVANNPMASLAHPNTMDLRGPNQAQLLGMAGTGVNVNGGLRGGFAPQQGQTPQIQPPLLAMRQQQPHLLPHMAPHLMPPHLQQQGRPGANTQPTHDLMALLMGSPRE